MAIISDTLKEAIESKDIIGIKSSFYTIILSDPAFATSKFDETFAYVKEQNIDDLIDAHDGEELKPEKEWDEEYYDYLVSKLQDNFSERRIDQIKEVAKKLNESADKPVVTEKVEGTNRPETDNIKVVAAKKEGRYAWVGAAGLIVIAVIIFRRLFKGGK